MAEIHSKKVKTYHPVKNYYKIITEDNVEYFAEKIKVEIKVYPKNGKASV